MFANYKGRKFYLIEIGTPEEQPKRYIEPIVDPIKRDKPVERPVVAPKKEPVPA